MDDYTEMTESTTNNTFDIFTDEVPDWPPLSCPKDYYIYLPSDRIYSREDYLNKKPFTPTPKPVKPDTSYTKEDYANKVPYPKE